MRRLARVIARELQKSDHCAVYSSEMQRVWPDAATRNKRMVDFAQAHHWRLRYYKPEFVAIFDRMPKPINETMERANRAMQQALEIVEKRLALAQYLNGCLTEANKRRRPNVIRTRSFDLR